MDIQDLLIERVHMPLLSTGFLEDICVIEASNVELISEQSTTGQQFINSSAHSVTGEFGYKSFEQPVQVFISDDLDDEAIHGRNRHRKRQARTNTR